MRAIPALADQALIQSAVDRIVQACDPVRVLLFGSRARGDSRPDSDADFFVILDRADDPRAVAVRLRSLLGDLPLAKDVVVSDRERFERRAAVAGALERTIAREGVVVFER